MTARILILLLLTASPGLAQTLNAEDFDAYTRGRTLYYGNGGQSYGVERYLDDRRVIWSFLDGRCQNGIWYEQAGQICFVYENNPDPQCWSFSLGPDGLVAQFESDPEGTELYEARDLDEKMLCYGPDVGA